MKITDFGVSTEDTGNDVSKTAGIGAEIAIAPEQHLPQYSANVDLWSFGILCWRVWKLCYGLIPVTKLGEDPIR